MDSLGALWKAECRQPDEAAFLLHKKARTGLQKCTDGRKEWPLTDQQAEIYLDCIYNPEGVMYNKPVWFELPSDIDSTRFREAAEKTIARHPAFGVSVALNGGKLVMQLKSEYMNGTVQEREICGIEDLRRDFVRPFRMGKEPLYRMALYHEKKCTYFLFDAHSMIFDDASMKVFLDEISLFYQGEEPPPEQISLMDAAVYEETVKDTQKIQNAREYLNKIRAELKAETDLLRDYKPGVSGAAGSTVYICLGNGLSNRIADQFGKTEGLSENAFFLASFAYALGECTGRNRSFFSTVVNGRHSEETAESVGVFARTVPVYQLWNETLQVRDYLRIFYKKFCEAVRHDAVSFEELAGDGSCVPEILCVYQEEQNRLSLNGRQYPARPFSAGEIRENISVVIVKRQRDYEISLHYRTDLYRKETAEGLLRVFARTLEGMISCRTLLQVSLFAKKDRTINDND